MPIETNRLNIIKEFLILLHQEGWTELYESKYTPEGALQFLEKVFGFGYEIDENSFVFEESISRRDTTKSIYSENDLPNIKRHSAKIDKSHLFKKIFKNLRQYSQFNKLEIRSFFDEIIEFSNKLPISKNMFWNKEIVNRIQFRAQRSHQVSRVWEDMVRKFLRSYFLYILQAQKNNLNEEDIIIIERYSKDLCRFALFGSEEKFTSFLSLHGFERLHDHPPKKGKKGDNDNIHLIAAISHFSDNLGLGMTYKGSVRFNEKYQVSNIDIDVEYDVRDKIRLAESIKSIVDNHDFKSYCENYLSNVRKDKSTHIISPSILAIFFPKSSNELRYCVCFPNDNGKKLILKPKNLSSQA